MDGMPDVIYLQDWSGRPAGRRAWRHVILPITDPYVVHHGALGSFATVYLPAGSDVAETCGTHPGAAARAWNAVLTRAKQAAQRFELPPDRIGDIVCRIGTLHGGAGHLGRFAARPERHWTCRCARTAALQRATCAAHPEPRLAGPGYDAALQKF
jgi:hypothetical protein